MPFACVCIEQFESRTLLSAGAVDPSYSAVYEGWRMPVAFSSQIRPQLDGKMIHYAYIGPTDASIQFWRTNPNGSLDKTFGSHGVINLGDTNAGAMEVTDFEVQNNGKFVALMRTDGKSIQLRRFNANGKPDTSFGVGGKSILSTPPRTYFNQLAVQDDGTILVSGNDDIDGYIRRFDIHGTADSSFGTNGVLTITPTYDHGFGWIMMGGLDLRRSDNRIVFSYTDAAHGGIYAWRTMVLAPNGHTEWSSGPPMVNDNSMGGDVVVNGDGSILASGIAQLTDPDGSDSEHTVLVRFPAPKSHDKETWIDVTADGVGQILAQPDDRVIIKSGSRIRRLNHDLSADTSFGSGGSANIDWGSSFTMAMGGDGKIVVDGGEVVSPSSPDAEFHSLRLTGDGPLAVVSKNTLQVTGTNGNDQISITKSAGIITAKLNSLDPFLFSSKKIKKLSINAGAGNDTIRLAKSSPFASIDGGDGDDTVIGKRRKDKITSVEHQS